MKVFRLLLSVILAMAGGFHMTWAGEIHGPSAGRNWNCFSCCTRTEQLVDITAGRARTWKGCGLRPFPCKARGLRFAHRRKGGKERPLSACPQPFHGAPGRTGPAGLPTPFPHPRPLAGDRYAFSTRPAAERDQHQQPGSLGPAFKIPLPPAASQRLTSRTSLANELIVFRTSPIFDRSPVGGGFGRAPPSLPPPPLRIAYWIELTESS